jgi:hypothetical protein
MSDRLYLSLWLEKHSALGMHRRFAAAVRRFPFSTQSSQCYLRVGVVDPTEPALLEQTYAVPAEIEEMLTDCEKYTASDSSFEIECYWDLWQELPEGWRLKPCRVNLFFLGPDFPTDMGESIRAELGLEIAYIPGPDQAVKDLHYYQSNIKSLLKLNSDWNAALRVEKSRLWSEAPGNLSERLKWAAQSVTARPQ